MQTTQKPAAWRGVVAVLLAVFGFFAGQLGPLPIYYALEPLVGSLGADIVYVALEIAIITGLIYTAGRVEGRTLAQYGLAVERTVWFKLIIGLCIGVGAFMLTAGPLYLTGVYSLAPGEGGAFAVAIGFIDYIGVGYMEELLCRGFLQHRMLGRFSAGPGSRRAWVGPVGALCLTALIFAALHLFNPDFSPIAFVNIFLAGTFMGAVMYATGSLWAAVGVHITWNWIQGSVLGIPVSGGERWGLYQTGLESTNELLTGGGFGAEASIVCTAVLVLGTALCLWLAKRNGRLEAFKA